MADGHAPAGWYPDPAGDPTIVRYWDGQTWTEQTQPMVNQAQMNNVGMPPVTPQPVYAPGQAVPAFVTEQPATDRKGLATAGLILGIVSLVIFCLSWFDFPVIIVGVILSALGLKSSKKGMAMAGLIMSLLALVLVIILIIVALTSGDTILEYLNSLT